MFRGIIGTAIEAQKEFEACPQRVWITVPRASAPASDSVVNPALE